MRKMSNAAFGTEPVSPGKQDGSPKDRRISLLPGTDVGNRRQSYFPGAAVSGLQRPSIVGLLASKRFAKRLSKRFISMRTGSIALSSRMSEANIINREPTYRMEPLEIFEEAKVREVIKECVDCRLTGYKYNPKMTSTMCKVLSEDVKERVKSLNYERYKIIVLVYLGERKDHGIEVTSRCVWDPKFDNYATYNYQNDDIFCTVTAYGIYNE